MSKKIDPNFDPDAIQVARSWVIEEVRRLRKLARKHDLLSWRKVRMRFLNGKMLIEASYRELVTYWEALCKVNTSLAARG